MRWNTQVFVLQLLCAGEDVSENTLKSIGYTKPVATMLLKYVLAADTNSVILFRNAPDAEHKWMIHREIHQVIRQGLVALVDSEALVGLAVLAEALVDSEDLAVLAASVEDLADLVLVDLARLALADLVG